MRTLTLFVLVVLALLTVRWFVAAPEPGVVKADPGEEGGARFLEPPQRSAAGLIAPTVTGTVTGMAGPPPAREDASAPEPAWPSTLLSARDGSADELGVAAALVHGAPSDVEAAAGGLPRDRAILLESFAWAIAGERQLALELSKRISPSSLQVAERELFEAALTGAPPASTAASTDPVARAMEMSLLAREAGQALGARRFPEAAQGFSRLLVGEIGAPWAMDPRTLAEWSEGLEAAQCEHRWNPRSPWPAVEVTVARGDTLIGIRRTYRSEHPEALMCTGLIERANRLKGQLQPGQLLRIPTDPARVLVDLEARWALFFLGDEVAAAWPVGIGRPGEDTPQGDYEARHKLENPPWMKEGQEPIPFGDPRNPLGTRWIGWARDGAKTSYGFHGTWDPASVGQATSDGCVRLRNEDVEELFQILPEGAPIRVQG
jgi:lipoprotein-anchoring transpeptidase ErfK/SrfK